MTPTKTAWRPNGSSFTARRERDRSSMCRRASKCVWGRAGLGCASGWCRVLERRQEARGKSRVSSKNAFGYRQIEDNQQRRRGLLGADDKLGGGKLHGKMVAGKEMRGERFEVETKSNEDESCLRSGQLKGRLVLWRLVKWPLVHLCLPLFLLSLLLQANLIASLRIGEEKLCESPVEAVEAVETVEEPKLPKLATFLLNPTNDWPQRSGKNPIRPREINNGFGSKRALQRPSGKLWALIVSGRFIANQVLPARDCLRDCFSQSQIHEKWFPLSFLFVHLGLSSSSFRLSLTAGRPAFQRHLFCRKSWRQENEATFAPPSSAQFIWWPIFPSGRKASSLPAHTNKISSFGLAQFFGLARFC